MTIAFSDCNNDSLFKSGGVRSTKMPLLDSSDVVYRHLQYGDRAARCIAGKWPKDIGQQTCEWAMYSFCFLVHRLMLSAGQVVVAGSFWFKRVHFLVIFIWNNLTLLRKTCQVNRNCLRWSWCTSGVQRSVRRRACRGLRAASRAAGARRHRAAGAVAIMLVFGAR